MPIMMFGTLTSHLLNEKLITHELARNAEEHCKAYNSSIIHFLVSQNILTNEKIISSITQLMGIQTFDLENYNKDWLQNPFLTSELVLRFHVIPLNQEGNLLHLGIANPTDKVTLDTISFFTGLRIIPVMINENELICFITKHYHSNQSHYLEVNLLKPLEKEVHEAIKENPDNPDEPIIRFVNQLIQHALHQKVSDIHIETFKDICRIRFRRDGILLEIAQLPKHLESRICTRLKVLSKCDISEKRLPQDGGFQVMGRDLRINICPTIFGEKIVLRILNPNKLFLEIDALFFSPLCKHIFLEKISQPQGLILVTGPTGSGKTVTLYSALHYLNGSEKNISTVEDPVEIQLNGINQVNVLPKIGLHFSTVLRALLRQDPDIIMIGEIRDKETAEIATQAALTGHLVLSTLHTTDCKEALTRLQAMGIEKYNLIHSITLIIAQRLIRKLCDHCKELDEFSDYPNTFRAVGCSQCYKGYSGRIPIYEFLPFTQDLKKKLFSEPLESTLDYMHRENLLTLKQAALQKIQEGITSFQEMHRVLYTSN